VDCHRISRVSQARTEGTLLALAGSTEGTLEPAYDETG
jgi:hypothetical protein